MTTLQFASKNDIQKRVSAIKQTWSCQERSARKEEASQRQRKLATMLGLILEDGPNNVPRLTQAS